ncbi:MAG: mucoidy inhibitor MuiA family protein, partial [Dongiaceae bacterium]
MRPHLVPLCLSLLFSPGGTILAADIDAAAPIDAVTVFPDRAEVTRVVEVTLPVGSNTVVIDDLPASLLSDSVRVEGQGSDAVVIGSVETKAIYQDEIVSQRERRLQADIQALQDLQRAASDRIAAFQAQLNFIDAIGREMPATANDQIVRGAMDPLKWQEAWQALGGGVSDAKKAIQTAEIEIRDIGVKINQKSQELSQIQTGRTATVVARINVEAKETANVRLAFSYQLPDATWRPIYDARLETEGGKVALTQIGEVYQRTGEDWSGVELTLSTTRPAVGATLPDLSPWFLSVADIGGDRSRSSSVGDLLAKIDEAQKSKNEHSAQELVVGGASPEDDKDLRFNQAQL